MTAVHWLGMQALCVAIALAMAARVKFGRELSLGTLGNVVCFAWALCIIGGVFGFLAVATP